MAVTFKGDKKMQVLQVGLGSMGRRRICCLKRLGYADIIGYDPREDRRKEACDRYAIEVVDSLKKVDFDSIGMMLISTPPDRHDGYIALAVENRIPAFVEASVVLGKLEGLAKAASNAKVLIAPSCTLRYHPGIKRIADMVRSNRYGKVTNFTYHAGQYLPDWHPFENVKDFYVSKKKTGGAREIVPFELTWITGLLGFPVRVSGFNGKTMDVGADIDDTYSIVMEFKPKAFGLLQVDVVSRYAIRNLILNMEYGQVLWRWDENVIRLYDARKRTWGACKYSQEKAARGYNKNIAENMYVDELRDFISATQGTGTFPNTLKEDIAILKLLKNIERYNEKR